MPTPKFVLQKERGWTESCDRPYIVYREGHLALTIYSTRPVAKEIVKMLNRKRLKWR